MKNALIEDLIKKQIENDEQQLQKNWQDSFYQASVTEQSKSEPLTLKTLDEMIAKLPPKPPRIILQVEQFYVGEPRSLKVEVEGESLIYVTCNYESAKKCDEVSPMKLMRIVSSTTAIFEMAHFGPYVPLTPPPYEV